jgi:predicted  nucleic acid-binding Zn-ribbon protein
MNWGNARSFVRVTASDCRIAWVGLTYKSSVSAAIVMLKNRLLLSLVTGGVGLGLSLLILRDFKLAAFTGLMGFVGSQAGVLVTSRQQEDHLHNRHEELRRHIRALQFRRTEVYEELAALQAQYKTLSQQVARTPSRAASIDLRTSTTVASPWAPNAAAPVAPTRAARVSWDLTTPRRSPVEQELDDIELRLQSLATEEARLEAALQESLAAKQQADLHCHTREAELKQIQAKVAEQTTLKQALDQTILELEKQQQRLQAQIPALQSQIQDLETHRTKLDREAASAKPSSNGSVALQGAIDQMQSQITALRSELGDLESQILDRRNQKQQLDLALQQPATPPPPTTRLSEVAIPATPVRPAAPPKAKASPKPTPSNGLSQEWAVFKGKLQPYEFQALCAIALEENPTSVLKRLAESNLTMPEMLIDTINEQALESIGDLILEAGHDASSTIIAQEYRDEVATLIATHR